MEGARRYMKLTKEEKDQLLQEIADDLPEYFAIFSPWMSLFLINTLLNIMAIAIAMVIFSEVIHFPFKYAYGIGMFSGLVFCVANGLVVSGYRKIGIRCLNVFGYIFVAIGGLASINHFAESRINILIVLVSGCLSVLITHSLKFEVFAYHREIMSVWGRERIKKNRAFVKKVKASRRK